jgi:glycosyltransferase involved in cell wall biosynthesis
VRPTVSIIIPTYQRPVLVVRAVQSALAQTLRDTEVIVVIEAPDDATVRALERITDPRLRLEVLTQHVAPGAARNAGVEQARGAWVAFLDDDDEWLPDKLAQQHRVARESAHRYPIVSCRLIARRAGVDFIWPRRLPAESEPISEYLFCRRGLFWGEGMAPSSTLFARRELLRHVPFPPTMRRQEDHHWVLEAALADGAGVEFVPSLQPLMIRHIDEDRDRIGNRPSTWRSSMEWIRANQRLVTRRAYAGFLLGGVSRGAARSRQWSAFVPLLRDAIQRGTPSARDIFFYVAVWLTPQFMQRRLAAAHARGHS